MARDPGSQWLPLPEAGAPDGYRKTQFIVHSTGSMSAALNIRSYFAQAATVVESTFIVGLDPSDPTLQIMDSTDGADANGSANQRAISVEVVGDGTGPFTNWQVSEIIRLGIWAKANHPIESRIIPSEAESGFGWHVMFGAPGPWTSVRGKVCPGAVRINQLKTHIFPAIFAGRQEDDLSAEDVKQINDYTNFRVNQLASWTRDEVRDQVVARVVGVDARVAALAELVRQLGENQGADIDLDAVQAVVEQGVKEAVDSIKTTVVFDSADQPEKV